VGAITAREYAVRLFPRRIKNPGFPVLPSVRSWVDEEIHMGGFRQQANNQTNHWLNQPGIMVLSML
jgi:hypothetical protein